MYRLAIVSGMAMLILSLTGCAAAPAPETRQVEPGASITMAAGTAVTVRGSTITLRFLAVTEDSRCPRDVTCIWAGEVKVALEILERSQPASQVELAEGASKTSGGYRVTLVRVEPYPTSQARIAPQDYRAMLQVDRIDTTHDR